MTEPLRPRALGLNHVALEVGDIEEALAFYRRLFRFELRSKSDNGVHGFWRPIHRSTERAKATCG
jgi:catechol 2,3-dioxygenase-like lactoylglutathione lyase family enzyme